MNLKENWNRIKADSSRRNPITNTLLYAIQIVSFITLIALIPVVIWSIGLLDEPEWTILDVYGKGFIPAWLAAIFTCIGNYYILQGNKKGLTVLLIAFCIICLPLMYNEYIEFVAFIGCVYGGLLLYWLSLLLKKNGISHWEQCIGNYKVVNYTIISVVLFLVSLFPPLVGYAVGFNGDLYNKGCICLDAHLNSSSYYKNKFGKTIAFSSLWRKEEWLRNSTAKRWFEAALYAAKEEYHEDDYRIWRIRDIYASYICFLLKQDYLDEAKTKYHDALEYISQTDLREEIEEDYSLNSYLDDYDRLTIDEKNTYKTNSPSKQSAKSTSTRASEYHEPQPHTIYEEVWIPCMTCHGDGKCTNCNGNGGYYIGNYYNVCGVCNGTGCCPWCGGRGQQMETRPKTVYY